MQLTLTRIQRDGEFAIANLPPGSYRLFAFSTLPPNLEYRNPEALHPYDSLSEVVRLTSGQKEHTDLQLIPVGNR